MRHVCFVQLKFENTRSFNFNSTSSKSITASIPNFQVYKYKSEQYQQATPGTVLYFMILQQDYNSIMILYCKHEFVAKKGLRSRGDWWCDWTIDLYNRAMAYNKT